MRAAQSSAVQLLVAKQFFFATNLRKSEALADPKRGLGIARFLGLPHRRTNAPSSATHNYITSIFPNYLASPSQLS